MTSRTPQAPPKEADQTKERVKFEYLAMDGSGRELKGTIPAVDDVEAVAKLKKQGLFPIEVWESKPAKTRDKGGKKSDAGPRRKAAPTGESAGARLLRALGMVPVLKTKILCIFTRHTSRP